MYVPRYASKAANAYECNVHKAAIAPNTPKSITPNVFMAHNAHKAAIELQAALSVLQKAQAISKVRVGWWQI